MQRELRRKERFQPLFEAQDERRVELATDWADGFRAAATLRWQSWKALLDEKDTMGLLLPILCLGSGEDGKPKEAAMDLLADVLEVSRAEVPGSLADMVPDCVRRIDEHWPKNRARRHRVSASEFRIGKVGRNDPCPCGSGSKYKKCCLN
jgi:yecA family protein